MKKVFSILTLVTLLTMFIPAFGEPQCDKIAVVDIQKIVDASSQVKNLKKAQEKKNDELVALLKKAQTDVNKQTDPKKKKNIAETYEKQLIAKREASIKEYTTKLEAVDSAITAQIGQKATELGYTIVVPKTSVIYGGTDITNEILKVIK